MAAALRRRDRPAGEPSAAGAHDGGDGPCGEAGGPDPRLPEEYGGEAGLRGGVEAAGVLSRRIRERFLPEQDGREDSDGGSVERAGR